MANITDANGTIAVKGPIKSVISFLELMDRARKWGYCTDILDSQNDLEVLTGVSDTDCMVNGVLYFSGSGRWGYDTNIKYLTQWLEADRQNDELWSIQDEMNWYQLNTEPIELEFTYTDVDLGQFIATETVQLTWKPNKILDSIMDKIESTVYDLTAENLINIAHYEDVFDYSSYTINHLDKSYGIDWVKYIQEYVKSEKVDYLKKPGCINTFVKKLGQTFDNYKNNKHSPYNSIWFSIEEWFEDEIVQKEIIETLNTI